MYWIIPSAIFILLAGTGYFFSEKIIHPHVKSRKEVLNIEYDNGNINAEAFDSLPREEAVITSPYGYQLHGLYFPNGDSGKTVIICHGITVNIYTSIKYTDLFIKRGYNVLIYDHRNHGNSGGSSTTFGYYEKYDLKAWIDWVVDRCGSSCIIGLHGESMGAAIALQSLGIDSRIAFCIADCPFSDLTELMLYRLKIEYGLPPFPALELTRLFCRLRTGMRFKSISPMRDVENAETPIFFVHGAEDSYIPAKMSIDMYNLKKGMKKLYLAPNSRHAESILMNRDEYDMLVGEFLEELEPLWK